MPSWPKLGEHALIHYLTIDAVLLSIGDFDLSYIEFVGTILYFASVLLIARKNLLTWPVGIISVILYGVLFYQIRLYAVAFEQVYYLGMSIYGWISWRLVRQGKQEIPAAFSSRRTLVFFAALICALTVATTWLLSNLHIWWPGPFPEPAALPVLDALTTVMSFGAMYLMARRRTECWIYWIAVNFAGIGMYWMMNVRFISLQYVVLLGMAVYGLSRWRGGARERTEEHSSSPSTCHLTPPPRHLNLNPPPEADAVPATTNPHA